MISDLPKTDEELVDRRWKEVAKNDANLKKAIENQGVNVKVLMRGKARDAVKIRWAKALS